MKNRFEFMHKRYKFNPTNSTGTLSGCIERNTEVIQLSDIIISTGGFSSINARAVFDTKILMLNLSDANYNKTSVNETLHLYKNDYLKKLY